MSNHLSAKQRADYEDRGYLSPVDFLSAPQAGEHHKRLVDIEKLHGAMHYRVKPYLIMKSAYEIATHPDLLDAVESVLGSDILLWDGSYVVKEPQSAGFVSWHQDLTYWGLEKGNDDDLVTAWVALTPVTTENGCMQFVRGSHKGQKFRHTDTYDEQNILHRGQSIEAEFDDDNLEYLELQPGQVSLHHGWAVHSSTPNVSAMRRVGLTLNYIKPSVRQVVAASESATLVRGQDDFGLYEKEPKCDTDFSPTSLEFQSDMERRKREVYDSA